MARYAIPKGRSIKVGARQYLVGPKEIDTEQFKPEQIAGMLKSGFLVPYEAALADALEGRGGAALTPKRLRSKGKWTHDPMTLEGKTLDALNLMIAEEDATAPRFETEDEAIALLSRDFQG